MGILARFPGTSGDYASTPDAAGFSGLSDFSVVALVSADDWTPAAVQRLASHWNATGNQRSWILTNTTTNLLQLQISSDGTTANTYVSTVAAGFTNATMYWIAVTRKSSDGVIKFYKANYSAGTFTPPAIGSFTQVGANVTGITGALHNSTSVLEIGSINVGTAGLWDGDVRRVTVYSGLYGSGTETKVAEFYPTDAGSTTVTSWTGSATGETWTLNGGDVTLIGDTNSGSGAVSAAVAVAGTGAKVRSGSAAVAADVAVAGTGLRTAVGSAAIAADVAVAGTGVRTAVGAGAVAADVAVSATGLRTASGSGAVAVDLAVSGTGVRTGFGSGAVAVDVAVAATGARTAAGAAAVDVAVAVSATGAKEGAKTGSGALEVSAAVSASGVRTAVGAAGVAVAVQIASEGVRTALGAADVAVGVAVAGQGAGTKAASGAVAIGVAVAADGAREAVGQAAVVVKVAIDASGQAEHFGSGAIGINLDISGASPSLTASGVPEYRIVRPRRQDLQPVKYLTESKTVLRLSVIYARPTVLHAPVAIIEPLPIRKVQVRNVETRSRVLVRSQHQVSRMQKVSHPASLKWEAEIRRLEELAIIGILEELIDASV